MGRRGGGGRKAGPKAARAKPRGGRGGGGGRGAGRGGRKKATPARHPRKSGGRRLGGARRRHGGSRRRIGGAHSRRRRRTAAGNLIRFLLGVCSKFNHQVTANYPLCSVAIRTRDDRVAYYPGNIVEGYVEVFIRAGSALTDASTANTPIACRSLRLKFRGKEQISPDSSSVVDSFTFYKQLVTLFGPTRAEEIMLAQQNQSPPPILLAPGVYRYPFAVQLPVNIPPSSRSFYYGGQNDADSDDDDDDASPCCSAVVSHQLRAILCINGEPIAAQTRLELTVILPTPKSQFDLLLASMASSISSVTSSVEVPYCCCCSSGTARFRTTVPQPIYFLESQAGLQFQLELDTSECDVGLERVEIYLDRHLVGWFGGMFDQSDTRKVTFRERVVTVRHEDQGELAKPNQAGQVIPFSIPAACLPLKFPPTYAGHRFQVSYSLTVALNFDNADCINGDDLIEVVPSHRVVILQSAADWGQAVSGPYVRPENELLAAAAAQNGRGSGTVIPQTPSRSSPCFGQATYRNGNIVRGSRSFPHESRYQQQHQQQQQNYHQNTGSDNNNAGVMQAMGGGCCIIPPHVVNPLAVASATEASLAQPGGEGGHLAIGGSGCCYFSAIPLGLQVHPHDGPGVAPLGTSPAQDNHHHQMISQGDDATEGEFSTHSVQPTTKEHHSTTTSLQLLQPFQLPPSEAIPRLHSQNGNDEKEQHTTTTIVEFLPEMAKFGKVQVEDSDDGSTSSEDDGSSGDSEHAENDSD